MGEHFHATSGQSPLLVSFPHDGVNIPADIAGRMTEHGQASTDTDWHIARVYDFLENMNVSTLRARWSRYVVDLNRPASGEALYPGKTESALCPVHTFDGDNLYLRDEPDSAEIASRVERYWQPYHSALQAELARLKEIHGFVILWDAHSIRGEVSRLFSGCLPDLNFGTNDQRSAAPELGQQLLHVAKVSGFTKSVLNGRFKGGYITRHYGAPGQHVHAVQLEINQQTYLQDERKVPPVIDHDKHMRLTATVQQLIESALAFVGGAKVT